MFYFMGNFTMHGKTPVKSVKSPVLASSFSFWQAFWSPLILLLGYSAVVQRNLSNVIANIKMTRHVQFQYAIRQTGSQGMPSTVSVVCTPVLFFLQYNKFHGLLFSWQIFIIHENHEIKSTMKFLRTWLSSSQLLTI